jgi:type VI secretion system protein ImpE
METVSALLKSGNLAAAIDATTAKVKSAPTDLDARWLLSELLVVSGQNDRADQQLDALMNLEPRASVTAVPVRQLLRAEAARRQFFEEGRVPELIDGADDAIRARLEAFVLLRAGDRAGAGRIVEQAEKDRPALPGKMGDRSFSDMVVRDAFEADVHLPAVYGTLQGSDDASRLGQRTDWLGKEGEAVVGVGRRLFVLDGEDTIDMMELQSLRFG